MAATPRFRDPAGLPTPTIHLNASSPDCFSRSDRSRPHQPHHSSSGAMPIPGSSDQGEWPPPPPLPPPRKPFDTPASPEHSQDFNNDRSSLDARDRGHVRSISSLVEDQKRRGPRMASMTDKDEGYASLSSAGSARSEHTYPSLAAGFGHLHNRFQLESGADAFVDMKKKLDPLKTLDNRSPPGRSLLSASFGDGLGSGLRENRSIPPLSMPTNLPMHVKAPSQALDSPDRLLQAPLHATVPPGGPALPGISVPLDLDHSPSYRSRRTNSDDLSTQGSYELDEADMEEAPSMKRLRLDDAARIEHHTVGRKRRAASPSSEDLKLQGVGTQSDIVRHRDVGSRGSPTPRLSVIPQSSISSASSGRNGSFNSGLSLYTGSSITSVNSSYGHLSPGGVSPNGLSPIATDPTCSSPYSTPMSLNPSPRTSISRAPLQRPFGETRSLASPRKLSDVVKPSGSKIQGFFMCECCPKKPKKFETQDELSTHEAEKQYECSFCGNRFKNKNEAERHQNSLHVRRHSWSCSALSTYDRAFHDSTNRPGEADTCGYCGEEFAREGRGPGSSAPRYVTDQNWEERVRHLQEVHKFRECNSGKKFYRADHFRQHLKHSHAGTSGKWTNMLENACMMEEDPSPR